MEALEGSRLLLCDWVWMVQELAVWREAQSATQTNNAVLA